MSLYSGIRTMPLWIALMLMPLLVRAQSSSNYGYFDPYISYSLKKLSWSIGTGLVASQNDYHKLFQKKYQSNFINPQIGVGAAYRITNFISLRVDISYFQTYNRPEIGVAHLAGLPAISSKNIEGYIGFTHDLFPKFLNDDGSRWWNAYLFAGYGAVYYMPVNADTKEKLRPEATAPQIWPYSKLAKTVPLGLGLDFYINDYNAVTLEAGYRFTESDYMDNLSWGSQTSKWGAADRYMFFGIKYKQSILDGGGVFNYKSYNKRKKRRK